MKTIFFLVLIAFVLSNCNATQFGTAKGGKVDLIKRTTDFVTVLTLGDLDALSNFLTDDFVASWPGQKINGKKEAIEGAKTYFDAFGQRRYKLIGSAVTSKNQVSAVVDFTARMTGDMGPFKATNNIVQSTITFFFTFNEAGLITKMEEHFDAQDFQTQLEGKKLLKREEIILMYKKAYNGEVDPEILRGIFADNFYALSPNGRGKLNAEQEIENIKNWRVAAPDLNFVLSEYFPSAEDEDLWLHRWSVEGTFTGPNPLGIKKGTKFSFSGVSFAKFGANDKMVSAHISYDPIDFAKQAGLL